MGDIVLLDELTINKIAAGEVIERPASVVKELVENSIDANATNICVEIKNGGISYIRITDNGKGINKDDLGIAFERHATSKIRQAEDLDIIKSMGFRGEALASIAAISNVELISKTKDNEIGNKIVVEAGQVLEQSEVGCPNGTTITISNLFFNTPVRYKFLKKDFTETGYIEDVITRLALVNTNIAFKLISSGKTIIQTSGDGVLQNVIFNIFGKDIANAVLDVNYEYDGIKISGAIGKPEIARSNRTNQIFFVNGRYVKDKTLMSASEQAYKGMITIGKFGFSILNVELNPQNVDVNVHPAKLEVRFTNESDVFKSVYNSIKDTMLSGDLISSPFKGKAKEMVEPVKIYETSNEKEEKVTKDLNNIIEELYLQKVASKEMEDESNISDNDKIQIKSNDIAEDVMNKMEALKAELQKEEPKLNLNTNLENCTIKHDTNNVIVESENRSTPVDENKVKADIEVNPDFKEREEKYIEEFDSMYTKLFGTSANKNKKEETKKLESIIAEDNLSVFESEERPDINYKFIGSAFSTYIIIEVKNEIYILDQHAAHERIMYEKVKKNFYDEKNKDSQMMLLPDIIELTHKELDIVNENFVLFEKAGFVVEEFGENTIKLVGVPDFCMELDTRQLFLDILDEIEGATKTAKKEIEEKFIATIACKAAVKANMALKKEEVDRLLEELLSLRNPFSCPHGRPTAIIMTKNDIEKKFSRK